MSKFITFILAVVVLFGGKVSDAAHVQPLAPVAGSAGQNEGVWLQSAEGRVAQRNFYGLTETFHDPAVARVLAEDTLFRKNQAAHSEALENSLTVCKQSSCFDDSMRWSDGDISSIAAELHHLYETSPAIKNYVDHTLRKSGQYPLYRDKSGADLLALIWTDAAQAMNRILQVYGDGVAPYYKVDAMRYDASSSSYAETICAMAALVQQGAGEDDPFFTAPMKYAVMLLAVNDRLDAARFDPLDSVENSAAIARAKAIDWTKYRYSLILVPGQGPEDPGVELSPLGRIRLEQAVRLYREGRAPFILLSGGTVHPQLTKYCEAVEMRRELINSWNIPASAILIDPYARHTTTNLRNATREIDSYHIPVDKPVLITSDYRQIDMIMNPAFEKRSLKELHFRPYLSLNRLSQVNVEMLPNLDSLQVNAMDPLDP